MEGLIMLAVLAVIGIPVVLVIVLVMLQRVRGRVAELETQVQLMRERGVHVASATGPAERHGFHDVASQFQRDSESGPGTAEPTLADLLRHSPFAASRSPPMAEELEPAASAARAVFEDAGPLPPPLPPAEQPVRNAAPRLPPRSPAPTGPGPLDFVRRWFTEGNVPVKVGMLVLFAGVAALLKYASDQGYLSVPIELRLAGIALAALAGLVFGWRQRVGRRSFGLSLQGGAIGVLLLVLFAAFKRFDLITAAAAFAGSVALVAGIGILAVRQNALALAVLGVLAGFLAPIWLSTGHGNHVALFGYYAVLNAGIVGIAWRRPWRLLNLMGFAFTFGIGALWGALKYRAEDFSTTEPFLVLFFAMYLAIPILYAAAGAPKQKRVFDGSLIFGTPLIAFTLQAGLLRHDAPLLLAYCALAVAVVYAVLAAALRKRVAFAELIAPYAVLSVGFATLAVPLALSAQATSGMFALEGAGLLWLGLRQERRLALATGIALQLAAAVAFFIGSDTSYNAPAVFNGGFMAALLVAVAGFASALVARRFGRSALAAVAYGWALAWWLGNGNAEIDRCVAPASQIDALMLFLIGTGALAAEAAHRLQSRVLRWTAAIALLLPIGLVWLQVDAHHQPFAGLGGVAWLAYALVALRALMLFRGGDGTERQLAHVSVAVATTSAASLSLYLLAADASLGNAWRYAAAALPWLALVLLVYVAPRLRPNAFVAAFDDTLKDVALAGSAVLAGFFVVGLAMPGDAQPLPYLPVANPLELVQIAALLLVAFRLRAVARFIDTALPIMAGAGFALATSIVLRADHLWGGVPWDASMFSTGLVQTSLTVLWSVIGMAAWVSGSRQLRRARWQAGAVMLAVVLAKLVLVDRQYLGNLLGIGSFLAFGLLCTAVGYLAPVPPRRVETEVSE